MATNAMTPKTAAERIGREYVEKERLPREDGPVTKRGYDKIAHITRKLYHRIPVEVTFQADDPYDDYADMRESVKAEDTLRVYNQHTDHRFFSHEEQLMFRAVHDWHGHLSADVDFSPEGEYKKWCHMKRHFGQFTNRIMFAEVVGQVGAVHYLPDGFADSRYEQRAFVAPPEWIEMMGDAVLGRA